MKVETIRFGATIAGVERENATYLHTDGAGDAGDTDNANDDEKNNPMMPSEKELNAVGERLDTISSQQKFFEYRRYAQNEGKLALF